MHHFDPSGRLLRSWGTSGSGPGEFNLPHNICCDKDGWLYVADRENSRIQIFDSLGRFETQINNMHRPSRLTLTRGSRPDFNMAGLTSYLAINGNLLNLGTFVSFFNTNGSLVSRLNAEKGRGLGPGQFVSPHSIALDGSGDIVRTDW